MEDGDGFSCFYPKNFRASYDLDDENGPTACEHYLDYDMYAKDGDHEPGSWVLLTKPSAKARGKRVAPVEESVEAKVAKMSPTERAAMLAALQA